MVNSYWLTRLWFLRGLGFIYFVAGTMLWLQGPALIGPEGITPIEPLAENLLKSTGSYWDLFWRHPTLLFMSYSDTTLYLMAAAMLVGSGLLLCGYANGIIIFILWGIQLSLVNGAPRFWSFGWETMLVESTFLSIFLVHPWRWNLMRQNSLFPIKYAIWLHWWMLFRLMLGAGLIKIRGDACWLDFTCMDYHYETQPNPHWFSWYYHHMPTWFHRFEIFFTHFVELLVPFGFLLFRKIRIAAGWITIAFQFVLISTGNLAFLNWQTIVICLTCFDDQFLSRFYPKKKRKEFVALAKIKPPRQVRYMGLVALILIGVLSVKPVMNMIGFTIKPGFQFQWTQQRMNESYDRFHWVNSYGLFGSITKKRYEVVISGTWDKQINEQTIWREYEFICKPSAIESWPCWVTPYHLRLDWQMWFSAFRPQLGEQWLLNFANKLLQGSPIVDQLISKNPFREIPPRFVKMDLYLYEFTDWDSGSSNTWRRKFIKPYMQPAWIRPKN